LVVEEQALQRAGVSTEGPALLDFFRHRLVTAADHPRIRKLIQQLGSNSFAIREKAANDLILMGPAITPLLRQALQDPPDIEVMRRLEQCLRRVDSGSQTSLMVAATRLVAVRKPAGATDALLTYLPFTDNESVADEVRAALAAVAVHEGKADPALVAALGDSQAVKRGAAGEVLCKTGVKECWPAIRKLLEDPDPGVRLQVGLALAFAQEKEAIPVLIDLLVQVPQAQAWRVEDLLYRLAEDKAPPVSLGVDEAARRKCQAAWAAWWQNASATIDLAKLVKSGQWLNYTLAIVLDGPGESPGRVLELDAHKNPRWEITGLQFPMDAQVLPGERVLITEHTGNRVTERDTKGTILWEKKVTRPITGQRLPNGHTFIATNDLLMEVDRAGKEIFHLRRDDIMKAGKLRNGEIVIATGEERIVRLDTAGRQLGSFNGCVDIYGGRLDVLANGHIVVPEYSNGRVVEYSPEGQIVWQTRIEVPIAAFRLPNGNTLITCMNKNKGVEVDRTGKEVWEYTANPRVTRLFRR
jgi:HEAT repeat protein